MNFQKSNKYTILWIKNAELNCGFLMEKSVNVNVFKQESKIKESGYHSLLLYKN